MAICTAVPALIELLKDNDSDVQCAGASILVELSKNGEFQPDISARR